MSRPDTRVGVANVQKHRKSRKRAIPVANQYKQQAYNFKKTTGGDDNFSQPADLDGSGGQREDPLFSL